MMGISGSDPMMNPRQNDPKPENREGSCSSANETRHGEGFPGLSVDEKLWMMWRSESFRRFREDVEIGYVDPDLVNFIYKVFNTRNFFTISSCSGRITLIDAIFPWMRDESYIVFKKHVPVSLEEVIPVLSVKPLHRLWLIVSGPIFHFVAKSIPAAQILVNEVRKCGFKHSGIISIGVDGIVVEVVSGTWTSFLLMDGDELVIQPNSLSRVLEISNTILLEGKKRIECINSEIERIDEKAESCPKLAE